MPFLAQVVDLHAETYYADVTIIDCGLFSTRKRAHVAAVAEEFCSNYQDYYQYEKDDGDEYTKQREVFRDYRWSAIALDGLNFRDKPAVKRWTQTHEKARDALWADKADAVDFARGYRYRVTEIPDLDSAEIPDWPSDTFSSEEESVEEEEEEEEESGEEEEEEEEEAEQIAASGA